MRNEDEQWKIHGPMHGERTRRYQKLVKGSSREDESCILTIYAVPPERSEDRQPRFYVETMVDGHTHQVRLDLEETSMVMLAAREFVLSWNGTVGELPPLWTEKEISQALDQVPRLSMEFGLPRSEVRRRIFVEGCPCGRPGSNPCWRMNGDAACTVVNP